MRKHKLFKFIDLIIYFNIFMFLSLGITSISDKNAVAVFSFVIASINVLYLVYSVNNRIKVSKLEEKSLEIEYETEEIIKKEDEIDLNYIKQISLERRIETEIKHHFPNSKIIRNAYIPKKDGTYSEIDLIAITSGGIFVIESKNITGTIKGTWDKKELIIAHPSGESYSLLNPIVQNTNHYYSLKNLLDLSNDYYKNIVVFGNKTYIESFKGVPYYAQVCKIDHIANAMKRITNRFRVSLKDYQIYDIYEHLLPFVEKTEEKKVKHLESIKNKKNNIL